MNTYPNLQELIEYHPYSKVTVCDHAQIEPELLEAVLEGREVLTPIEIIAIARLYRCPIGLLEHPKIVMLDMNKYKHNMMVTKANFIFTQLKCMARDGNAEASKYLRYADWYNQKLLRAAYNNKVSYGCYLGIKEQLTQYVRFSTPMPKRRGLTAI